MSTTLGQIPRNSDGLPIGAWRVVHSNPNAHGLIGPFEFANGRSVTPAAGILLVRLVAMHGNEIDLEPWDDPFPRGWTRPDGIPLAIPDDVRARFTRPRAPVVEVAPPNPAPMPDVVSRKARRA